MSRFTFLQLLNVGALKEEMLGEIFRLGLLLLRFGDRTDVTKAEILTMKPEELFNELEDDLKKHPEQFGGPGPERVRQMIAEVKAFVPEDEFREGKIW